MEILTVAVDVSSEAHPADTLAWAARHDCRARMVQECGPAGGNPLYHFKGTHENLLKCLTDDYTDQETAEWMLEHTVTNQRFTENVLLPVTPDMKAKLQARAKLEQTTMSALIRQAIMTTYY